MSSDPRNLELSLATIFRPQNSYCVHVDHKSSALFRSSVSNMLECYRRKYPGSYIYPATMSYDVYWGHFSIVEAELICMRDLLTNGRNWSYALNMAGSEVMLATNLELVNILSKQEGERFSESAPMSEKRIKERISVKMNYDHPENGKDFIKEMLDPPPHNMSLYKGGKSWLLPRQFLQFIFHHPAIREFLGDDLNTNRDMNYKNRFLVSFLFLSLVEWSKWTFISDETVIPTLVTVSNITQAEGTDGVWRVAQDFATKPNFNLAMFEYEFNSTRCRGVIR